MVRQIIQAQAAEALIYGRPLRPDKRSTEQPVGFHRQNPYWQRQAELDTVYHYGVEEEPIVFSEWKILKHKPAFCSNLTSWHAITAAKRCFMELISCLQCVMGKSDHNIDSITYVKTEFRYQQHYQVNLYDPSCNSIQNDTHAQNKLPTAA